MARRRQEPGCHRRARRSGPGTGSIRSGGPLASASIVRAATRRVLDLVAAACARARARRCRRATTGFRGRSPEPPVFAALGWGTCGCNGSEGGEEGVGMRNLLQVNGRRIFFFGALGGLLFGYDTGVISGAILFIKSDFGLSPFLRAPWSPCSSSAPWWALSLPALWRSGLAAAGSSSPPRSPSRSAPCSPLRRRPRRC